MTEQWAPKPCLDDRLPGPTWRDRAWWAVRAPLDYYRLWQAGFRPYLGWGTPGHEAIPGEPPDTRKTLEAAAAEYHRLANGGQ